MDNMQTIFVEVMEGGRLPVKAHPTDAGFDLFSTSDIVLMQGAIVKHPLNIRMMLPDGSWARIETKSGLGSKGMLVFAGVVDQSYRGVPHVIATNLSDNLIYIKKGDKIAQMTMNPHHNNYQIVQVESVSTDTDRGTSGFGASGK